MNCEKVINTIIRKYNRSAGIENNIMNFKTACSIKTIKTMLFPPEIKQLENHGDLPL